jgi:hypothetical protein
MDWDTIVLEFVDGYTGRNGDETLPLLWSCAPLTDYLIGTHTQEGIWMLAGDGIVPQQDLPIHVMDLPAIILHYLGMDFPAGMKGEVPASVFDQPNLRKVSSF